MDERRDLVDRKELRQELELEMPECVDGKIGRGRRFGLQCAIGILNSLDAVECPRGWTRDEVLAELDADPDAVCEWLSIHDAEWHPETMQFITGSWHPEVRRYDVRVVRVATEPEWVPLTQLVGRTIDGCSGAVNRFHVDRYHAKWWALHDLEFQDRPFPEGTLNLETGQVAVRPKGAT
jgi:hypothetical protein